MRALLTAVVIAFLLPFTFVATADAAAGGTLDLAGGFLTLTDQAGQDADVVFTATLSTDTYVIANSTGPITTTPAAAAACMGGGTGTVTCTDPSISGAQFAMADGSDSLQARGDDATISVHTTTFSFGPEVFHHSGLEQLDIRGTPGQDFLSFSGGAAPSLTLEGGGGDDQYDLTFGGWTAPVAVRDTAGAADTLILRATGPADRSVTWQNRQIVVEGLSAAPISPSGIDSSLIFTGDGNDTFTLASAPPSLGINSAGGRDRVWMSAAMQEDRRISAIGTGHIALTVEGTPNHDTFDVNHARVQVEVDDAGPEFLFLGEATRSIAVFGRGGHDTMVLLAPSNRPVRFAFSGGAGNDECMVDVGRYATPLACNLGSGRDTVRIIGTSAADSISARTNDRGRTWVTTPRGTLVLARGGELLAVLPQAGDDLISLVASALRAQVYPGPGSDRINIANGRGGDVVDCEDSSGPDRVVADDRDTIDACSFVSFR